MIDPYSKVDDIIAFMEGKTEGLTEAQQELYNRLDFADNQIRQHRKTKKAAEMIMAKFGVSSTTAWRDMNNAQQLWGSIGRADKKWYQNFAREKLEIALGVAMSRIVDENGEARSSVKTADIRLVPELIAELRRTVGYDQEALDMPDFSNIGAHEIRIEYNPESLGYKPVENLDELILDWKSPKKRGASAEYSDAEIVEE